MPVITTILLATTVAGYSCRDLADPQARRWFQDEPCAAGFAHDPLPEPPLFVGVDERAPFPPPANSWPATDGSRVVFYRWGGRGGRVGGHRGGRR